MVIYIDILIIVNVYITYFVLRASARLLRAKLSTKRLIIGSVVGGVTSAAAAFPLPFWAAMLIKALLTVLIAFSAFGFSGLKDALLRSFTVLAVGMVLCGAVILIREWSGCGFLTAAGGYIYADVSIPVLVVATIIAYVLISLFRRILDKPTTDIRFSVFVKNKGKTALLNAFPDSGNTLCDFLTGLSVIVCRYDSVIGVAPEGAENALEEPVKGVRLIPYSTVNGSGFITAFRAEEIIIKYSNGRKKRIDALIGIGNRELGNGEFDAVINPKLLI